MKLFPSKTKTIDINKIQPGNVLIAQKFWDNELFHRSVILILEHDETGTTGIILNKSNIIKETFPLFSENKLLYGGTYDSHRVGFIHKIKNLERKTIKISDDIYFSENCTQLQEIISIGGSNSKKVKAFIGFTVWSAGQLFQEILQKKWWVDSFKLEELYTEDGKDLWESKLLKSENLYGLFSKVPDPSLN